MKNNFFYILIAFCLLSGTVHGGWLDQFIETKKYADETDRYVKKFKRLHMQNCQSAINHPERRRSVSKKEINRIIFLASRKYNLHPDFIRSIISVESNFQNHALSEKGAQGLMQLMPQTCETLHVSNPWDPTKNIMAGTRYIKALLVEFKDVKKALAAYNFGPSSIRNNKRWPKETRVYVARVLNKFRKYRTTG